jgi:uncharacterized protein YndB with AHSA1/START domain
MSENRIERSVDLKSSPSKVWKALTDHQQFNQWFGIRLTGPFTIGKAVSGFMTYPGWEHISVEFVAKTVEPETRFAYEWHPYAVDPAVDYSGRRRSGRGLLG